MSNEIEKIGDVALNVVDGKYVADAVKWVDKAAAVLATAIKDQPEVKTLLETLIKQASTVAASVALDISTKGVSLTDDAATITAVEAFFQWFQSTLVPGVESIYTSIKTDIAS